MNARNALSLIVAIALTGCNYGRYQADTAAGEDPNITFGAPGGSNADTGVPFVDADGDGFPAGEDCNDLDASVYPGAPDTECDGSDKNCDGSDLVNNGARSADNGSECGGVDGDGDSYTDVRLDDEGNLVTNDCNDADPLVNPGADEIFYNDVDENCDGLADKDADNDGFDAVAAGGLDCDDMNSAVNPDATEILDDDIDQNCDPTDDESADDGVVDADGDGFAVEDDCDDTRADIHPDADEIPYNADDEDCDDLAVWDVDCDGVLAPEDCDDNDALVYDTCDVVDADGDGYDSLASGGDDCDDNDATVNPGAIDVLYDAIDQDCDGHAWCDSDGDGFDAIACAARVGEDCDDTDATVHPDAAEVIGDDVDNDCDVATLDDEELIDACADGYSVVSGSFTAPAGSTFESIYGRRVGPNEELIDDWFNDNVSWTDGSNDPANMLVVYDGDTVVFVLDSCVADVGAKWVVNGKYIDAFGVEHWICEGSSLTVIDWSVLYDAEEQTVSAWNWGGGCDALWQQ